MKECRCDEVEALVTESRSFLVQWPECNRIKQMLPSQVLFSARVARFARAAASLPGRRLPRLLVAQAGTWPV